MKVSIIIPAHNEEKRIDYTLNNYSIYFEKLRRERNIDYEIIVVINATKDRTEEIVKRNILKNNRIKYLNLVKGGKGYAVIQGFKDALKRKSDLLGFVDADMATPPEAFHLLIDNIKDNHGIIASRWRKDSKINKEQTILGKIKSKVFNFIVRFLFLFNYKDTQCGAKLFNSEAAKLIVNKVGVTKWAFDIDILYHLKKRKYRVIECETIWEDKEYTKIDLIRSSLEMLLAVVRLRLLNSPFSFIVRTYDIMPKSLKIHHRVWKI